MSPSKFRVSSFGMESGGQASKHGWIKSGGEQSDTWNVCWFDCQKWKKKKSYRVDELRYDDRRPAWLFKSRRRNSRENYVYMYSRIDPTKDMKKRNKINICQSAYAAIQPSTILPKKTSSRPGKNSYCLIRKQYLGCRPALRFFGDVTGPRLNQVELSLRRLFLPRRNNRQVDR